MNPFNDIFESDFITFVDLSPLDINPGIVKCRISVAHTGANRNMSYISDETMISLAKSLRGTPIVGYFNEEKEDFGGHEDAFANTPKTRPYGFVPTDAKVWLENIEEEDGTKTYLFTEGYLWVRQFPELNKLLEDGVKGQSMELDRMHVEGHWAKLDNSEESLFIIEEGTPLSKLCILGDDVEPCFKNAAVITYSVDSNVVQELKSMMFELEQALKDKENEGRMCSMENEAVIVTEENQDVQVEEHEIEADVLETQAHDTDADVESETQIEDTVAQEDVQPVIEEQPVEQFACGGSDKKRKYELSDDEIESLLDELDILKRFKKDVEKERKNELIKKYYMLDESDLADIREHFDDYSYEDIEMRLALAYVNSNVVFNTTEEKTEEVSDNESSTIFSIDSSESTVSPIVQTLRNIRSQKNAR